MIMYATPGPLLKAAGVALAGSALAVMAACVAGPGGGSSASGHGGGRAQSDANTKAMAEVRATGDRMVADAKAASAARVETYWRDAGSFRDIRDKVCKIAPQPESNHAGSAKIASLIKSLESDNARLRAVTTDAQSRVERRSNVNNALIASECGGADLGMDAYSQCSSMTHARSWHAVIAHELADLNTINDAAAGWTKSSLECLNAGLTKRLEKENLDLSQSIYQAWSGYKSRRAASAQSLDDVSVQFVQSK